MGKLLIEKDVERRMIAQNVIPVVFNIHAPPLTPDKEPLVPTG
jgi:hypothetical protein